MSAVETLTGGDFGENTYLFECPGGVAVVDPGVDAKILEKAIKKHGNRLKYAILTHGHVDHISSISSLEGAVIYAHREEKRLLESPALNLSAMTGSRVILPEITYVSGSVSTADDFIFYHTPGHTAGSMVVKYGSALFTGDTLFADTIGRCDLPTGDPQKMAQSLRIFRQFDLDMMCYPGHGAPFTLGECFKSNFFLNR